MELTRQHTTISDNPNDWIVLYQGKNVARYYSDYHRGQSRWQWFINFSYVRSVEGIAQKGICESEEDCKKEIRAALELYEKAGAIRE